MKIQAIISRPTLLLSAVLAFVCLTSSPDAGAQTTCRIPTKKTTGISKNTSPDAQTWIKAHFAKGVTPPFSFEYGGKPSVSFIRKWRFSAEAIMQQQDGSTSQRFCWKDPSSGLKVICDVAGYPDFNAVEWTLRFENEGQGNSLQISNVKTSDVAFTLSTMKSEVITLRGSNSAMNDFEPMREPLNGITTFASVGGRSSDVAFPFFNLRFDNSRGVFVSIGWTGNWTATFGAEEGKVSTATGMSNFDTYLLPGESVRVSRASLMFYDVPEDGDFPAASHNRFRRFIMAHHTRRTPQGKLQTGLLSGGMNWGDPAPLNEYTGMTNEYARFLAGRYHEFDIMPESFWLDAGWYEKAADWRSGQNWSTAVGNWTIDSKRFPNGFRDVSEKMHEYGAGFMVWFEPERVRHDSNWAKAHSEWMLRVDGGNGEHNIASDNLLFNLGNPEACSWLINTIGNLMEENGIDHYRQDFNIRPEAYWAAADEPGRQGITEAKYIEGLYMYWDALLQRHPGRLIDNCASGGRRLDLETTGRSVPLWRTDYQYGETDGEQSHTYGLELFLPFSGTGIYQLDAYSARSAYCSAMVLNWKLTDNRFNFFRMKEILDEYKTVRPYFCEDYYPLTGIDNLTSRDRWVAYELMRPSDETGYILAFRRENSTENQITVRLAGLDKDRCYRLINADTEEVIEKQGAELAAGLNLQLDSPRSSLLIRIEGL